jgi:transposase
MESVKAEETWVGLDWGDKEHAVALLTPATGALVRFTVPHTPAGMGQLRERLAAAGVVRGVAIERSRHLVVDELLTAGYTVYPINPKVAKTWRDASGVQASKTDARDAETLARGLFQYGGQLRALKPDDPQTAELHGLCHGEMALIAQRTALVQQLQAALKAYYPEALDWFADWTTPTSWDFVVAFPEAAALRVASRKKLCGFFAKRGLGPRPCWLAKIDARAAAPAWCADPVTVAVQSQWAAALVKLLHAVDAALAVYAKRIAAVFAAHPDAAIFASLPGAGKKLAPRMLIIFGADRARYEDAGGPQKLSGTVPVTVRSGGQRPKEKFRWACRPAARQTMHLFADCSRHRCDWAQAFYAHARAAGDGHAEALRKLGVKWLKIIFRMWQERQPYDEARYLNALIRHGSPLIARMRETATEKPAACEQRA